MKKMKNNKNLLMIIGIIVLIVVIVGVIIFANSNNGDMKSKIDSKTLEDKLKEIGKDFYSGYYHNLEESTRNDTLSGFVDNGIRIDITNVQLLVDVDQSTLDQLKKDKCNFDETKITVYPKSPFGENDYSVSVELSCQK